jgi:hypothetical protein
MKCWWTMPHAGRDRVATACEGHRLAVDGDGALVGSLHAVEDLHQRRLAGAVLPHDRVHVPALHGDVDVAVGHDAGERLVMRAARPLPAWAPARRPVVDARGHWTWRSRTSFDGLSGRLRQADGPVRQDVTVPGPGRRRVVRSVRTGYSVGTVISPEMICSL